MEYSLEDITLKGAWAELAALELHAHALAPIVELSVPGVISAVHMIANLTPGSGRVVHDYLDETGQ